MSIEEAFTVAAVSWSIGVMVGSYFRDGYWASRAKSGFRVSARGKLFNVQEDK